MLAQRAVLTAPTVASEAKKETPKSGRRGGAHALSLASRGELR